VIAVIFEFTPAEGRFKDYMALVDTLREDLARAEGFISLQFWRDDECVRKWRNLQKHREAQKQGRGGIFESYRLRIASVIRDYEMDRRDETPEDSLKVHG